MHGMYHVVCTLVHSERNNVDVMEAANDIQVVFVRHSSVYMVQWLCVCVSVIALVSLHISFFELLHMYRYR